VDGEAGRLMPTVEIQGRTLPLELVPCDFCGGTDFVALSDEMRHGVDLRTVLCWRCALCMTNPRPTAEASRLFNADLYNEFHGRHGPIAPDSDYVTRSRAAAKPRVERLARVVGAESDLSVFEIGAGVGQFQAVARETTKWRVSGIEPGQEQAKLCQSLGLDVQNVFLEDLPAKVGPFDVVYSSHVIEHTPSPADFLRRVNRLLKPGGLLHLEVPNLGRPGFPLSFFLQFPHLYNFEPQTLRNYLTAIGGFRPVHTTERVGEMASLSRKVGPAHDGAPLPDTWEGTDVDVHVERLLNLDAIYRIGGRIPDLPLLGWIRETLLAV
jgi:SAM-dependent methyltransferase